MTGNITVVGGSLRPVTDAIAGVTTAIFVLCFVLLGVARQMRGGSGSQIPAVLFALFALTITIVGFVS